MVVEWEVVLVTVTLVTGGGADAVIEVTALTETPRVL